MKTLKQLTTSFDYVNPSITEDKFPLTKREHKGYKLFHFDRYISSEDVVAEMAKEGYAPANLLELLSWKDWNGKDRVGGLGSVGEVLGGRGVPCLDGGDSGRGLSRDNWDGGWDSGYRFLAVRLSSETVDSAPALGNSETLTLEARVKSLEADMENIKKFLVI
jgi:hypothetical protein